MDAEPSKGDFNKKGPEKNEESSEYPIKAESMSHMLITAKAEMLNLGKFKGKIYTRAEGTVERVKRQ